MKKLKFSAFVLLVMGLILAYPIAYYSSTETKTITVKDKERITKKESSYYLVYCEEGEFMNDDSWLFWKWDSSEVYNKLEPGKKYKVKLAGWRWNFFSWYENIVSIEESKD